MSHLFEDVLRESRALRLYIGHDDPNINAFALEPHTTSNGTKTIGMWATSSKEVAKSYSYGGYVSTIEVTPSNSTTVDWKGDDWGGGSTDEAAKSALENGHDCIIFKNVVDAGYVEEGRDGWYAIVANDDEHGVPLDEDELFKPATNACILEKIYRVVKTEKMKTVRV
jgi:hypothetical protein